MDPNPRSTKRIRMETERTSKDAANDTSRDETELATFQTRDLAVAHAKIQALEKELALAKQEIERLRNPPIHHHHIHERSHPVLCNDALLQRILKYLPNTFRFTAAVNKRFKHSYAIVHKHQTTTAYNEASASIGTTRICLAEGGSAKVVCRRAARNNSAVLQHVIAERPDLSQFACLVTAECGSLELFQWAVTNECDRNDPSICYGAARNGHLAVLQWARADGWAWNRSICYGAAQGGHLEVLQWARANGCRWNRTTTYGAAQGGHLEFYSGPVPIVAGGIL